MKVEQIINDLIAVTHADTNQISDGYHTFAELYEHRIALFIALCKVVASSEDFLLESGELHIAETTVWRSRRHSDGEMAFGGEWFVLGIGKEQGKQITYHLPLSHWEKTDFAQTLEKAPHYDGHTPTDVLERLGAI